MLLNLMPCVLPVLSLKLLGIANAHRQSARTKLRQALLYLLGVLVAFWVLAGTLIVLKMLGEEVGWGFQLQNPLFVGGMICLFFVIGLNLLGVFEMGTSLTTVGGVSSSFLNGVLATVVATPCTGPFLGTALAFAFTLSPFHALLIFSVMGLGMALPFLLFGLFPKLMRFFPKPGAWMVTFKQAMGFLLMASVLWLLWVFGEQRAPIGLYMVLSGLLILGFAAWIYGHFGHLGRTRLVRRFASAAALAGAIGAVTLVWQAAEMKEDSPLVAVSDSLPATEVSVPPFVSLQGSENSSLFTWNEYSEEKLQKLRARNIPVFVDFTARWCLICQANHIVLNQVELQEAFAKRGVVCLRADWTKRDDTITRALQSLGRNAVPLYVLYLPQKQEPLILPQVLTKGVVLEYLEQLPVKEAQPQP